MIFSTIQERSIQILFPPLTDKKNIDFSIIAQIQQKNPNFNHILSNEIAIGANRKFLILTGNGLKVISANQRIMWNNHWL